MSAPGFEYGEGIEIDPFTLGGGRVGPDVPSQSGPNWTRLAVLVIAGLESTAMLILVAVSYTHLTLPTILRV